MLALFAAGLLSAPLTYRLGSASLTPPEPLPLGGYTARSGRLCELPGEPLEARALVLERGTLRVAIVSADLLTIPDSLREEVQKRIPAGTKLFLVATHTHCAPDSQMLNRRMDFSLPGIAKFNEKWLSWSADRIAASVAAALGQQPKSTENFEVALGRRTMNRGRRQGALPDTLATRLIDSNAPLITHFAAHAVLYGPQHNRPDPDFPGRIRGDGLFLPGAIGDMSPASTGTTPEEQVQNFGRAFLGGPWKRQKLQDGTFDFLSVPIAKIEVRPNPEFAKQNRIPEALGDAIVRKFAPSAGALTLVRLGKLVLVGVPGEPTAELGRAIRSAGHGMGYQHVLTVSHCNGWMGYILSRQDYGRGGYEASLAFHGPDFGPLIVQSAKEGMARLAATGGRKGVLTQQALAASR